jgi:acyl-CoA reductase-like NAD-dependent aldehyde dehydrogenase
MQIARDETFGPVLSTIPFPSEDEGFRLANRCSTASSRPVYARDLDVAFRVSRELRAGTAGVHACSEADIRHRSAATSRHTRRHILAKPTPTVA